MMFLKMSRTNLGCAGSTLLIATLLFPENALLVSTIQKQSRVRPHSTKYVSIGSRVSLSVPDLKSKTDWKRPEGVVVAIGCGLDLPGSSGAAGRRQAIYS